MCLAVILLIIQHLASWWIGCPLLLIVLIVVVHEHVIEHLLALIVVALGCALVRLHHQRDFFGELKQVYAVLRVTTDDLCALDVREVVLEDFLTQQIDQCLDILSHFFLGLCLFKRAEVDVGKGALKKLNVELV